MVSKSLTPYIFWISTICVLFFWGCGEKETTPQKNNAIASLNEALANIQSQTDTGYHHLYQHYKKHLDSLEKIALSLNYHNGLGRIYFMVGSMNRWMRKNDTALLWLEKSYREVKGTNTLEEVHTLLEIGDVYLAIGKKRLSNDYFYRAKVISEKINSSEAIAKTYRRLALTYYQQSSYKKALELYSSALYYTRKTNYVGNHNTAVMNMLNNIGVCYNKLGKYDSAIIYYDSALQEATSVEGNRLSNAKGVFYGNKGRIYQLRGNYTKAIHFLTKNIIANATQFGDNQDAITSLTYLAEIYNALDSNKKFQAVTDTALYYTYIINNITTTVWRARLLGLKADYCIKKGNITLAYKYRIQQYYIKDSLMEEAEKEGLHDVILYRQLKDSEVKREVLEKDNKSQKTKIEIYFAMAILVIALLILAIIGLTKNRRNLIKQKILYHQISEKNQQITLNKTELEQAIEELKLLNAEKNKLLGMVAHDLRGPIYNITGVVQLLESSEEFSQFDEGMAQLVELIKKSCDNALNVINDLLDAAKLENGGLEGEMQVENLNDVIKDVIKLYQSRANQKQIVIEFRKPQKRVEAIISKEKINRAISNLLSNAIKFSKPNNAVNVVLAQAENTVLITVSDKGMGIPLADREIIFDKFTKAKRLGTDGEKPVGLGMSIVKQIVEAHNGRIWLESEVGAGTTFYIELPLKNTNK